MKRISLLLLLIAAVLPLSCRQGNLLDGFDDKLWKEDYNACGNRRQELVRILLDKKESLKKLDDDAIAELLGTPERNRQFSRGIKNYIYFVTPGKQCTSDTTGKEGKKLIIEFDALGNPRIIRESFIDY